MDLRSLPVLIKRDIPNARLPINYEAAKVAIAECAKIDECKEWVDKAVAIASYARQAQDETMMTAAKRIQLRAEARLGELILELPQGKPGKIGSGRFVVANKISGISYNRFYDATSMARVERRKREKLIEKDPPISRRNLVDLGVDHFPDNKILLRRSAEETYRKKQLHEHDLNTLENFIRWTKTKSVKQIINELTPEKLEWIRKNFVKFQEWIDEFEQRLPKKNLIS